MHSQFIRRDQLEKYKAWGITPSFFTIHTAVNRVSRSGQVIGAGERVTPLEALEALTIDGARMYGEESRKGSIEPGKLADLVVLSANPLTVPSATIDTIRVTETIKDGKTVWKRSADRP